jgi:hypothetical protein
MSDPPADYRAQLDLRAEIARIDRDRAEAQKLTEESQKLVAEQRKLLAEDLKLAAERRKLDRERWLPARALLLSLLAGLAGGIGVAVVTHLWK